ncbi:MAG: T9SS type A sorting domain-containing protein [bacterium]
MDILLSLKDHGKLNVVTGVFYSYFAQHYIDSYYIVEVGFPDVGVAHSSGRQGIVYVTENGTPNTLPNGADGKLHMTCDINVIHAPDFSTWRWAELGNPYYETNAPTGLFERSITEDYEAISRGFNLHEPYPNPFNGSVNLSFALFEPGRVTIEVFNLLGKKVTTLLDSIIEDVGIHRLSWQPSDVPSSSYFIVLSYNQNKQTRRVIYLR